MVYFNKTLLKKIGYGWGTWVAQSVECLTFGLDSSHDLTVCEIEPHIWLCTESTESAWDSLSLSVSLSQNKENIKKKDKRWVGFSLKAVACSNLKHSLAFGQHLTH